MSPMRPTPEKVRIERGGVLLGTGNGFVRLTIRGKPYTACTFWTDAPIRPNEIVDIRLDEGSLLVCMIVMRPPSQGAVVRASAVNVAEYQRSQSRDDDAEARSQQALLSDPWVVHALKEELLKWDGVDGL